MYHGVRGFDDHPIVELSMKKGSFVWSVVISLKTVS
jgi:hypothetical protein